MPKSLRTLVTLACAALLAASVRAQTVFVPGKADPLRRARIPIAQPKTYGTSQVSYAVVDASELSPVASGIQYAAINNSQLRYVTNSFGENLMAPVSLPPGAYVLSIEIDYYDASESGEVQASLMACDPNGYSCAMALGNPGCDDANVTVCSGNSYAPGYASHAEDLSDDGITVQTGSRYVLFAGNTTTDGSTAISRIRIAYVLQVSPPPATATFNDVPTTDPAFQFVEAISASGITAGCGGGNYCPDSFITRRQMAVFLAKALGLQWN
ncbi:MAG TPA: S-layer homology domain-containing protein [Thermoanaerobaculia bacterium]|nr:S-layer homology domain-containing protein [Thermoanaerobaculia bacterium]